MTTGSRWERTPAVGLVGAGAVSVQFGAAVATRLFHRVGPGGAVTLRIVLAAVVLLALVRLLPGAGLERGSGLGSSRSDLASGGGGLVTVRPRPPRRWADRAVIVSFGLVLAAMNLSFYESIARIPLGVAVTIEFSGPMALALLSSRRLADSVWAVAAGAGVALLAGGAGRHLDRAGVALALLAGAFWAAYILLSREAGRRFQSIDGLAWAMAAGGLALLPFGIVDGGPGLLRADVLGLGALVAVVSSVVPYSLELVALRRVSPRAFGVMMSLDPALAAVAGLAVLGQHLTAREWAALALVAGANLGNSLSGRGEQVVTTSG